MTRVVVVGGGIAGLAAARRLAHAGDLDVVVLEGSPRFGGKVAGVTLDGVDLDAGAESVLARRPEATDLIDAVGLGADRVAPTDAKPAVLVGGRAVDLPPSLQGVPTDPAALAGLLTTAGLARARAEVAGRVDQDVAIGTLVEERFGAEVTDRLLEPLLGGVYAGRSRELSLAAVVPGLFEAAREPGLLSEQARSLLRPAAGPVFAGVVGGVARLVPALVDDLEARGVEIRAESPVVSLARTRSGFVARLGSGETLAADGVVVAVPAGPAGRLLDGLVPSSEEVATIPYASVAVITAVVGGLEPAGSGLLVPPGELPTIKAMTHSSRKWDWVAERARSVWGEVAAVVRFSVGRHGEAETLQVPDDALLARTLAEARDRVPGWGRAELLTGAVSRWGGALPQYRVGHRDLVARVTAALPRGVAVCGAWLDGVGIAACVASGDRAAERVRRDLG